jgi:DNA-binding NtrC family response regulator
MVLPGMNGCELAAALKRSRPQMKILLMSGYTMDMVASQCKPAQKLRFIQKPFTICELDAGVRQALQEEMPES